MAVGPWSGIEVYGNAGFGFHSNDARGTVIVIDPANGQPAEKVDPLVRSIGAEIGLRMSPVSRLRSTIAVWTLELDSELLFVGDGGTTEPSDKSRRTGIEFANAFRAGRNISFDLDLTLTRARLINESEENRIPGALESVLAAGVMFDLSSGISGALRIRHFGEYPLVEDNSMRSQPSTLVNASLGYRFQDVTLTVSVLNALNEDDSDIQYYYGSHLLSEATPETEDVHFHPVEPRSFRLSLSYGL